MEIERYSRARDTNDLPPHLFAIAQNAFSNLVGMGNSQSVIISGESGSGKTEATKIILRFLMSVSGAKSGDLAKKILATNPILEAFGNAKTIRNNNSSRFGKLVKINFEAGVIKGARINSYLLEGSRVVAQAPEERSYHVFYQMLKGATPQERDQYCLLKDPTYYKYLTHGDVDIKGTDDAADWFLLKESFNALQIPKTEQDQYFTILSAVLHLGNVKFVGEDKVVISPQSMTMVDKIAKMLQVSNSSLKTALEQRLFITPRATSYYIPLTLLQAIENRDAMAKALYSKMFDGLIDRLNQCLLGDLSSNSLFIAILDIYGFELFEKNSMEQFCINYANEKLHDQFNQHMFKAEQEEYIKEGIPWKNITFADNRGCIELIEKNGTGLIALLNEECSMPKGNEESLMQKFKQNHSANKHFSLNPRKHDLFEIIHYADPVTYSIEGFLLKNKNTLNADVTRVLMLSGIPLMAAAFGDAEQAVPDGADERISAAVSQLAAGRGTVRVNAQGPARTPGTGRSNTTKGGQSSKATQCTLFKRDLLQLTELLESSNRHYVRCIKPNETKEPDDFHQAKVLRQLKSNGVMETVTLRKHGYLSKMAVESFFNRYAVLGIRAPKMDFIKAFLIQLHDLDVKHWAIGKTKVFLRSDAVIFLEENRKVHFEHSVYIIQASILRFNAVLLANLLRGEKQRELRRRVMHLASLKLQCLIRGFNARLMLLILVQKKHQQEEEERQKRELEEQRRRSEIEKKHAEEARRKAEEKARQDERMKQEERLRQEQQAKQEKLRLQKEADRLREEQEELANIAKATKQKELQNLSNQRQQINKAFDEREQSLQQSINDNPAGVRGKLGVFEQGGSPKIAPGGRGKINTSLTSKFDQQDPVTPTKGGYPRPNLKNEATNKTGTISGNQLANSTIGFSAGKARNQGRSEGGVSALTLAFQPDEISERAFQKGVEGAPLPAIPNIPTLSDGSIRIAELDDFFKQPEPLVPTVPKIPLQYQNLNGTVKPGGDSPISPRAFGKGATIVQAASPRGQVQKQPTTQQSPPNSPKLVPFGQKSGGSPPPSPRAKECQDLAEKLCTAATKGDINQLKTLCYHQSIAFFVNLPNSRGQPALYCAAKQGCTEAVQMLLKVRNIDVNYAIASHQGTALHAAAFASNPEIVTMLLARGADPTKRNKSGMTAQQEANGETAQVFARAPKFTTNSDAGVEDSVSFELGGVEENVDGFPDDLIGIIQEEQIEPQIGAVPPKQQILSGVDTNNDYNYADDFRNPGGGGVRNPLADNNPASPRGPGQFNKQAGSPPNNLYTASDASGKIKKDKDKKDKDKDKDKDKSGKRGFFGGTKSKKDDSEWDYIDTDFQKTYLSTNDDYWIDTKEHRPSLQELEALAKTEGIVFNTMSMNARTAAANQGNQFVATHPGQNRLGVPGGNRNTASVENSLDSSSGTPGATSNPAHSWGARSLGGTDSPSRAPSGSGGITISARAGSNPPTPAASGGSGFGVPVRAATSANISVGIRPGTQPLQPLSASSTGANRAAIARPIDIPTHRAGVGAQPVLQPSPTVSSSGHRQFFSARTPQNDQPNVVASHQPTVGVGGAGVARPVGRFQPGGLDSQTLPIQRPAGVPRYQTESVVQNSPDTPRPVVNRYQTQTDFTSQQAPGSPVVSRFGVPGGTPTVGVGVGGARAQMGSLPGPSGGNDGAPARPVGRFQPGGLGDSPGFARPTGTGGGVGVGPRVGVGATQPQRDYTQPPSFGVRPGQGAR